ncbi:Uncharacterised protein [Mycobacterium tuberculosis]|nr:Uncharacterised protein [Mycobacterium tuberculosis]
MCRLGIAAYGFAPADTTSLPQVAGGWCMAMMSVNPSPGSSLGGVVGQTAKQQIAISVTRISVLRAHAYAGFRRHHSQIRKPKVPITYVVAYSHAATAPSRPCRASRSFSGRSASRCAQRSNSSSARPCASLAARSPLKACVNTRYTTRTASAVTISRAADPARPPSSSSVPDAAGAAPLTAPLPPRASLHPLRSSSPRSDRTTMNRPSDFPSLPRDLPGRTRLRRTRTGLRRRSRVFLRKPAGTS